MREQERASEGENERDNERESEEQGKNERASEEQGNDVNEESWELPRRRRRPQPNVQPNQYVENERITSFFVTNLPYWCSLEDLWRTFKPFGNMVDAFLTKRKDKLGRYFAFVRFEDILDGTDMAKQLSQVILGRNRAVVNVAKFGKNARKPVHTRVPPQSFYHPPHLPPPPPPFLTSRPPAKTWAPNPGPSFRAAPSGSPDPFPPILSVHLPSPVSFSWKKSSLIGKALDLNRLACMEQFLSLADSDRVSLCYVGGLNVFLTFQSSQQVREFLSSKADLWKQWFSSLEIWNGQDVKFERIAWLKIMGVPLQFWDKMVMNSIGEKFGTVVQESQATVHDGNLSFENVGILVQQGNIIEGEIQVSCLNQTFPVFVQEVDHMWVPDFCSSKDYVSNLYDQVKKPNPKINESKSKECPDTTMMDQEVEEGEITLESPIKIISPEKVNSPEVAEQAGNIDQMINRSLENETPDSSVPVEINVGCMNTNTEGCMNTTSKDNLSCNDNIFNVGGTILDTSIFTAGVSPPRVNGLPSRKRPRISSPSLVEPCVVPSSFFEPNSPSPAFIPSFPPVHPRPISSASSRPLFRSLSSWTASRSFRSPSSPLPPSFVPAPGHIPPLSPPAAASIPPFLFSSGSSPHVPCSSPSPPSEAQETSILGEAIGISTSGFEIQLENSIRDEGVQHDPQ